MHTLVGAAEPEPILILPTAAMTNTTTTGWWGWCQNCGLSSGHHNVGCPSVPSLDIRWQGDTRQH